MQNVHFTPPKLAKIFEINESTIKRWIDNGMLKASKSPGGHRRVSQEQLNEFISSFPKYTPKSYVISRYANAEKEDVQWSAYYSALLKNKPKAARDVLNKAWVSQFTLIEQLEKIIQPTLVSIGNRWQDDTLSIYEEHRMSFHIRQHFEYLRAIYAPHSTQKRSRHALLACAPGDQHEMPLQMIETLLSESGWKTSVLGINISLEEMIQAMNAMTPDMLCISNIYGGTNDEYLRAVIKQAKKLQCQLVLGGAGWGEEVKAVQYSNYVQRLSDFKKIITL